MKRIILVVLIVLIVIMMMTMFVYAEGITQSMVDDAEFKFGDRHYFIRYRDGGSNAGYYLAYADIGKTIIVKEDKITYGSLSQNDLTLLNARKWINESWEEFESTGMVNASYSSEYYTNMDVKDRDGNVFFYRPEESLLVAAAEMIPVEVLGQIQKILPVGFGILCLILSVRLLHRLYRHLKI